MEYGDPLHRLLYERAGCDEQPLSAPPCHGGSAQKFALFDEYKELSGRTLSFLGSYQANDAEILLFVLGSSYYTAMEAVDTLRREGIKAGVITLYVLRPFPAKELRELCKNAKTILVADRQDSYGAGGGNMTLEIRAALQELGSIPRILSRIYGLGGMDFFVEDAIALFRECLTETAADFDYYGVTLGTPDSGKAQPQYFKPITKQEATKGITTCVFDEAAGKNGRNRRRVKGHDWNADAHSPLDTVHVRAAASPSI